MQIRDALRDLVAFAQFKKREKHPWRSATFSKVVVQMLPNHATHHIYSYEKYIHKKLYYTHPFHQLVFLFHSLLHDYLL